MTTNQPPTTHYSPDGRYWWDGTNWQPVQVRPPAPQPPNPRLRGAPAPPAAPRWGPPAPQPGAPAPQGSPPRRGPRTVLLVGVVAAVALVAGLGSGAILGSVRNFVSAGPGELTPIPEEFPGNGERYLQGVTVSQITQEWQATGPSWTCEPGTEPSSGAAQSTRCTVGADRAHAFTLNIDHDGEDQIREVDVSCRAGPDSQTCRDLFAWLAETVLRGEPDRQQEARDWAAANAASDLATTIGRVHLEVRLEPRTIFATPAP